MEKKRFCGAAALLLVTAAVLAFTVVYGTVHLSITKYGQWETDGDLIAETYDSVEELNGLLPEVLEAVK